MKFFVCWTCKEFGHFLTRCPKRRKKTRKSLVSDKVKEFKESMERFLNDNDNEPALVIEEKVIEETTLVTIMESGNVRVDEKSRIQERVVDYNSDDDVVTKKKNDEVFFENNNDL